MPYVPSALTARDFLHSTLYPRLRRFRLDLYPGATEDQPIIDNLPQTHTKSSMLLLYGCPGLYENISESKSRRRHRRCEPKAAQPSQTLIQI